MNNAEQSQWTLLQRPRSKNILGITFCFAALLFLSGASLSSPLQVGVVLLCILGYIFLFDLIRLLI